MTPLRLLLLLCLYLHATAGLASGSVLPVLPGAQSQGYVCPPCPHVDDLFHAERHDQPGTCPVCGMKLVELPDAVAQSPALHVGAGAFVAAVGPDRTRRVSVFYYRPHGLTDHSPVLFVLPGAGRNAWDYRDHWIDAADEYGVLVLALHYPETDYPEFWSYNLAGMITDVVVDPPTRTMTGYRIVDDRQHWLFDDIDTIFEHVARGVGLKTDRYDLFGHSAGGQFLHRFALFAGENSKAGRIVAANSGWYTVPNADERFPYGLADAPIDDRQLATAFRRNLIVFLGGADDETETRGELVRSEQTDRQGLHRLARGRHFHERASAEAAESGVPLNWTLHVVPNVGHDAKAMSQAAARWLYIDPPHH